MKSILQNWAISMIPDQSKWCSSNDIEDWCCFHRDLPPSQGGKFTGFGNPQCKRQDWIASFFLMFFFIVDYQPKSSNTDLHEIIQDPRAAIEKGWSLLSYVGKAAVDFGRTVNETYVKPAAAQLADPQFRDHVRENVNHYVQSITQPRVNADRMPELVTHLFF